MFDKTHILLPVINNRNYIFSLESSTDNNMFMN